MSPEAQDPAGDDVVEPAAPVVDPPVVTPSPRPPLPDLTPEPDAAPVEAVQPRAVVRYSSDDTDSVSLPGELNAVPSIVKDGDVTVVDAEFVDELTTSDHFEAVEGDPADFTANALLSDDELQAKLSALPDAHVEEIVSNSETREDVVAQLDAYDKVNPQPPGNAGGTDTEDNA